MTEIVRVQQRERRCREAAAVAAEYTHSSVLADAQKQIAAGKCALADQEAWTKEHALAVCATAIQCSTDRKVSHNISNIAHSQASASTRASATNLAVVAATSARPFFTHQLLLCRMSRTFRQTCMRVTAAWHWWPPCCAATPRRARR